MQTLAKIRVIVTRPEPEASAFAEMLAARGIAAILSPVMAVRFLDIRPDVAAVGTVAFTSVNGVRAYCASGGSRGATAFAVGEKTAAAAHRAEFDRVLTAAGDVAALARTIAGTLSTAADVLHVVGQDEAGDLVGALRAAGLKARHAVGYAADAAPELSDLVVSALKACSPGLWVAHFSARSAGLFRELTAKVGLQDQLRHVRAACLSPSVARAAGGVWAHVAIAGSPDAEALIDAILKAK